MMLLGCMVVLYVRYRIFIIEMDIVYSKCTGSGALPGKILLVTIIEN